MMNYMSALIEKGTRIQSAYSFYELGKSQGMQGKDMLKYVADGIDMTMGQWGVLGRAPIFAMKSIGTKQAETLKDIDKSFSTFKTFMFNNVSMYEYFIRNKAWGALATKMAIGTGLHGITKFPLIASMFAFANLLSEDEVDYQFLRVMDEVDDALGGTGVFKNIITKGAFAEFGIDASNLFSEESYFDAIDNMRSTSVEGKIAEYMLGAPLGYAKDIIASADATYKLLGEQVSEDAMLNQEEKKRANKNLARITPLFLRNALSTMTLAKDGVELQGDTIVKAEDLDTADIIYKALSFQPLTVSKAYEEQFVGVTAKLKRLDGKINELKKLRKEPDTDKQKIAQLIREAMTERINLLREQSKGENNAR